MKSNEVKTIEIKQGNATIHVASASERLKAIREDNTYSVYFKETKFETLYNNDKAIPGWLVSVRVTFNWLRKESETPYPKEVYEASYFKALDDSEYGTIETALSTAQTRAISKALAHAGVGIDDVLAGADEIMGSRVEKRKTSVENDGMKPITSIDEINDKINDKINEIVNREKEESQLQPKKETRSLDDMNLKNEGEAWEYIFAQGYLSKDDIGKDFKPTKTLALAQRIIEAFESENKDEAVFNLIKNEKWDERFPNSAIVLNMRTSSEYSLKINDNGSIEVIDGNEVNYDKYITLFYNSEVKQTKEGKDCYLFTAKRNFTYDINIGDEIMGTTKSGDTEILIIDHIKWLDKDELASILATPVNKKHVFVLYPQGMTLEVKEGEALTYQGTFNKEVFAERYKELEDMNPFPEGVIINPDKPTTSKTKQTTVESVDDAYIANTKDGKSKCICFPVASGVDFTSKNVMFNSNKGFMQADVIGISGKDDIQFIFVKLWNNDVPLESIIESLVTGTKVVITGQNKVSKEVVKEKKEEVNPDNRLKEDAFNVLKALRDIRSDVTDEQIFKIIKKRYNKFLDLSDFAYKCNDGELALIKLEITRFEK